MNRLARWTLCLLLFLTACRVPGATRPVVKIGLVAPFEGRYRYVGYGLFAAVRLALREINATGGIGYPAYSVELVAYDDGADPEMARQQAEKLAVDSQIVLVIGHFREATTRAALPIYAREGLPLLAPAVLDPALTAGPGAVFRVGPDADELAARMLEGVSEAGLLTDGGPLGEALQREAARRGVALWPVSPPANAGRWRDLPPVLFCDAPPVDCGEALAALHARGWAGKFLGGPDLATEEFRTVAGDAATLAWAITPWPDPRTMPECADFVAACTEISLGIPPTSLALPAYAAARYALSAIEWAIIQNGRPNRTNVTEGLSIATRLPPTLPCGK
ncbi:MAG: ABC transporter substrate-binding protein [Anaerolineae bacterium]|nr:ABC transporter substrate-binding protein [Anaerolineae bacterium]MDW7991369.1 ABC transporter substrate-binding protein [Anaerolineae bacterium]